MHVISTGSSEEFVTQAVQWITGTLLELIEKKGQVVLGISGGKTPAPIFTRLATESIIPWKKVCILLVDERYVPADHPDSNQHMVRTLLLNRSAAEATLIAPNTSLPIRDCVAQYEDTLQATKPDVVLLGMGDDAHIASLFPPLPPEAFGPSRVIQTHTLVHPVADRISLTLPVLLAAQHRLFLVTGTKKAQLVSTMQQGSQDVSLYPAQYLFDDRTMWIVGA